MEAVYSQFLGRQENPRGPLFVMESGLAATHLSWLGLAQALAKSARVFLYDRPGFGFSAPRPEPRTAAQCARELASIAPQDPAILVAHSYGCLIARLFAEAFPSRTRALLLLDPIRLSEFHPPTPRSARRIWRGTRIASSFAFAARIGVLHMALRLAVRKPRAVRLPAPAARLFAEIAKMQPEAWPLLQHHWSRPEPFVTFRRYLESIQASCADGSRFASLGSIPVTVISGAHLTPAQLAENERWARTSSAGRHIAAPRGRHWIHLDVPDLVLEEAKRLSSDRHV